MDKKISELDLLTQSSDDDLGVIVDIDDSSGITKKVELVNQVPSFVLHAIQDLSKNIANLEAFTIGAPTYSPETFNASVGSGTTISDTVTFPNGANMAIVQFVDCCNGDTGGEITIYTTGKTSGSLSESWGNYKERCSASLSGDILTLTAYNEYSTGGSIVNGTVYFF